MGAKAHGRILFWEGASLWVFSAPPGDRYPKTDVHSHHVTQVTLALTGRVDFDGQGKRVGGQAIAIAPDTAHAFEATGLIAHLFIAPDGQAGRAIVHGLFPKNPMVSLSARQLGDFPARLKASFEDPRHTDDDLCTLGRGLITHLAGEASGSADPRIERLIPWVSARLDQPVSLGEVAELIGLSPGRTRHLFVQQTGLPFRTWVLWLRLERATRRFAAGSSLTEAAHDAGFSDSAHLSRTFRRMFGINAASLRLSQPFLSERLANALHQHP
ncbi:MAG: AraC family transcriptional regulator [Archangium sp.]|nr:AraC family transcriptional regulator [Archangium sp.]